MVTNANGVAGSIGLAQATNIFTWTAHPFNWNAADFQSVTVQADFKTDASGYFDDDRIGWMTTSTSVDSTNFFGVQLDNVSGGDGGIVTYWRNAAGDRVQTPIVAMGARTGNTWYRFAAQITKLTATSAKIDVSLVAVGRLREPNRDAGHRYRQRHQRLGRRDTPRPVFLPHQHVAGLQELQRLSRGGPGGQHLLPVRWRYFALHHHGDLPERAEQLHRDGGYPDHAG